MISIRMFLMRTVVIFWGMFETKNVPCRYQINWTSKRIRKNIYFLRSAWRVSYICNLYDIEAHCAARRALLFLMLGFVEKKLPTCLAYYAFEHYMRNIAPLDTFLTFDRHKRFQTGSRLPMKVIHNTSPSISVPQYFRELNLGARY